MTTVGHEQVGTDLHTRPRWGPYPEGQWQHEETAQKGKRNILNLRSDQGANQPRPRRGDPIAKVGNHMGEEKPQESAQPEPAEERSKGKKATKPVAKQTVGAQPEDSKVTYLRLIAEQQMRPGEDSPLAKSSDKPGKSAATSHKKFRQTEGGRMNTTTRPQKRVTTSERNNHQCKTSIAIKSDKKTLLTQRVTTSRRKTQEKQTVEAPTQIWP